MMLVDDTIRALLVEKANLMQKRVRSEISREKADLDSTIEHIDFRVEELRAKLIKRQSVKVLPVLRVA